MELKEQLYHNTTNQYLNYYQRIRVEMSALDSSYSLSFPEAVSVLIRSSLRKSSFCQVPGGPESSYFALGF